MINTTLNGLGVLLLAAIVVGCIVWVIHNPLWLILPGGLILCYWVGHIWEYFFDD